MAEAAPITAQSPVISSFDGQVMRCQQAGDLGRMAYQVTGLRASLLIPKIEVEADIETLKCQKLSGVYRFVPAPLNQRTINVNGGFIEFQNLELVSYTPDLKVRKFNKLDIHLTKQKVKFLAPARDFVGLLPRNWLADGSRSISLMMMVRGNARIGDAQNSNRTVGQYASNSNILEESLGAHAFRLSERSGNLVLKSRSTEQHRAAPRLASDQSRLTIGLR